MNDSTVDWDAYARQYDQVTTSGINPAYLHLMDRVVDAFDEFRMEDGACIVDLGGGTGNFSLHLAALYPRCKFIIVDNSQVMLDIACKKAKDSGLDNVVTLYGDIEDIAELVADHAITISHVLMIHSLYATRSSADPDKPMRVLRNIYKALGDEDSRLVVSDINRPLKTWTWTIYCAWHALRLFKSFTKTYAFFLSNDQAVRVNHHLDDKQRAGEYLLCDLGEFVDMVRRSGFSRIFYQTDKYYRGRDNFLVAGR